MLSYARMSYMCDIYMTSQVTHRSLGYPPRIKSDFVGVILSIKTERHSIILERCINDLMLIMIRIGNQRLAFRIANSFRGMLKWMSHSSNRTCQVWLGMFDFKL